MPTTTYKGLSVPTTGTEADTWGDDLNANSFGIIDRNLGAIVTKTLSNVNVSLSSTESQAAILRLTGTLTGAVQITTLCQGFTYVENLTTGSFAVTFANGAGTPITLAQGARTIVITDATNGPRSAADASIPSGASTLFFNAAAPSGWTKSTANDNKAIRIVSGTGGATGGSTGFTSVLASRTPAGTVGGHTLTVAETPAHRHQSVVNASVGDGGEGTLTSSNAMVANYTGGSSTNHYTLEPSTSEPSVSRTSSIGGDGSHTHTWTGTAMDFAILYIDAIICTKD